jgi:hypothetical protein
MNRTFTLDFSTGNIGNNGNNSGNPGVFVFPLVPVFPLALGTDTPTGNTENPM